MFGGGLGQHSFDSAWLRDVIQHVRRLLQCQSYVTLQQRINQTLFLLRLYTTNNQSIHQAYFSMCQHKSWIKTVSNKPDPLTPKPATSRKKCATNKTKSKLPSLACYKQIMNELFKNVPISLLLTLHSIWRHASVSAHFTNLRIWLLTYEH